MINEGDAVGKRIGNCPFFSSIWEAKTATVVD